MPMTRDEFRAMQNKLQMTNYHRHLRQADKAANNAAATIAGVVLVFSHDGEDEVHYFDATWIDPHIATEIRKAVEHQLRELEGR
jgi:hypothetical protein